MICRSINNVKAIQNMYGLNKNIYSSENDQRGENSFKLNINFQG